MKSPNETNPKGWFSILGKVNDIKMKPKLIALFLVVGLVPLILTGWLSARLAGNALEHNHFAELEAVRQLKKIQIERYFTERQKDMAILVDTVSMAKVEAFDKMEAGRESREHQLERYFAECFQHALVLATSGVVKTSLESFVSAYAADGNKVGGAMWKSAATEHTAWLQQFSKAYGFPDVLLISKAGDVVFSTAGKADLGTHLVHDSLRTSGLGKLFAMASEGVSIVDFAPYALAEGGQAAFIGAPIKKADQVVGMVALRLSREAINTMIQERFGLGKTGEFYLVGQEKGQEFSSYRSDRIVKPGKMGEKKTDLFIKKALAGESGSQLKLGSTGKMEIVTYSPIEVKGLNWAIIGTTSAEEAFSPVMEDSKKDYFADFINDYGYYDLFLIDPSGMVFYTVGHEPDYLTNMIDGQFSSSNLGVLVRQVLRTGQFGIADFQPYAPSKDAPSAFVAQPVIRNGKTDLVVALQLSEKGTNAIMQERTGMGKTGETFLVGKIGDLVTYRSDRTIYPGKLGEKKTSPLIEKALAGESGAGYEIGNSGAAELVSSSPVGAPGINWAVVATISKAEMDEAVDSLILNVIFEGVLISLIVVGIAIIVANSIAKPLVVCSGLFGKLAAGDLTIHYTLARKDEIGQLVVAFNAVSANLREMFGHLIESAKKLGDSSRELDTVAHVMADGARTMTQSAKGAAHAAKAMSDNMHTVSVSSEQMSTNMHSISAATEEMSVNMNTISSAAEEANTNLSTVAAASEQASTSMTLVRDAASRSGENIESVASAVKDMSASLSGIREKCQRASEIARQADLSSKDNMAMIEKLVESTEEIGAVVETINNIAQQTNMLALNASIEAAGAGEAGKGFSVVANEVKDLSIQTGDATTLISKNIEKIKRNTQSVITATTGITTAIGNITVANAEILREVDEQSYTVDQIAQSMASATGETVEVGRRIDESSHGIEEVNRSMQEISSGIEEVVRNVVEINSGIQELTRTVAETSIAGGEVASKVGSSAQVAGTVSSGMEKVQGTSEEMLDKSQIVSEKAALLSSISADLNRHLEQFTL